MDGPLLSAITITPMVGRLAIAMTSAIAAASWRIVRRSIFREILTLSALATRALDIGGDRFGADVERVVLTKLMAIGTEQERRHGMHDRTVALAHPAKLERGEHLVDIGGLAGQKAPAVAICALRFRVARELGGSVVLGI